MNTKRTSARRARTTILVTGLAGFILGGATWAAGGGGCSHDVLLDLADASLEKAAAQVVAAENGAVVPPFGSHDVEALRAISRARKAVAKAFEYAESSCDANHDV
jgi:hypothetical protein